MTDEAAAAPAKASRSSLLRELVVFFLRLGFTAFGGPAAHILPAAALTLALAWAYVRYGALPQSAGVLYGVKPAIIAKGAAIAGAAAFGLWPLFTFFLKVGAVPFGSGYVLLAFLRADLERWHWLTEAQLLDAVAVGQVTPGPVFTTATFIGYVLGGLAGAGVATLAIFLPAFLLIAVSGPLVPKLRRSPTAAVFLDEVNVASLALTAAVTWHLARAALVDPVTIALAVASAALLLRLRLNSVWLILAGAVVGCAWRTIR